MCKGIGEYRAITLTAGVDNPALSSGNDTINGVTGDATPANNSYTLGDTIVDTSTTDNDTLNLTLVGNTASPLVTVTNIENIVLNNTGAGNHTFTAAGVTGAKVIKANVSTAGNTETVSNIGALTTAVELAGKGNLAANYTADLTGSADAVTLNVNGAGTSATTRSNVDFTNGGANNNIETVNLAATGTNYVDLRGGTAVTKIVVTGAGALDLQGNATALTGDATNNALTIDASAATGKQTYNLGAGAMTVTGGSADDTFVFGGTLGSTDKVDGGAGKDTVTMDVTTAVQVIPELTSIETLTAKFSAAGIVNASKATSVETVNVEVTTAAVNFTNLAAGAKTVNFNKDAAAVTSGAVSLGYATGAAADVTLNIGEIDNGVAAGVANKGDAIKLGATTLSNVSKVTVNSVRDADNTAVVINTIAGLNVGTATDLTVTTSDKASLTTGNLTAGSLTNLTLNADGGDLNVGTLVDAGKLSSLTATAANKADVTIGAIGGTTKASALESITITTGAETTLTVGAIDAFKASVAATTDGVSALKDVSITLGDKATTGGIAAITAAGAGSVATNVVGAALNTFSVTTGTLDGNITIGGVTADSLGSASISVADQTVARNVTITSLGLDKSLTSATIVAGKNATVDFNVDAIAGTTSDKLAVGTVTASGEGNVIIDINGAAIDVESVGTIDASAVKGTTAIDAMTLNGTAGVSITIGEGGTGAGDVNGSDKADVITGGKGADVILGGAGADQITGGLGADIITGGAGQDTIDLTEATQSVDTIRYAESGAANVDTVTGFAAGTDLIRFTAGAFDGGTIELTTVNGGVLTSASTLSAVVRADAADAATALAAGAENVLILRDNDATTFGTAIGANGVTATTGLGANEAILTVWYDSLNGQAVFGFVEGAGTTINNADAFTEVTRLNMSYTDFTEVNIVGSLGGAGSAGFLF